MNVFVQSLFGLCFMCIDVYKPYCHQVCALLRNYVMLFALAGTVFFSLLYPSSR